MRRPAVSYDEQICERKKKNPRKSNNASIKINTKPMRCPLYRNEYMCLKPS